MREYLTNPSCRVALIGGASGGGNLLPETAARAQFKGETNGGRVRGVFLYEPGEAQIVRNFAAREPDDGEQTGRARVSWLLGEWLREECARHNVASLPARPWETLLDRVIEALS